ncbi:PREDICTED: uncharacterized protein LOC104800570 isoform X2 [Tarenaya hassleriana]|uniref:uncharacterized protein LOC104800570 isoform X2 n=1 Tax=Tarenaya hassleriana TaxID=28532 RepID=UPI00053C8340|nr:PREDICTED: uncharacterized protein LOC104800570 isoform X2 [Tarenaya hassleriana]
MAKDTVADEFVVVSQVRTGLKRELQFVLRSQSEICGGEYLGRTRARKNLNCESGFTEKKASNGGSDLKYARKKWRVGKVGKGDVLDKSDGAGGGALEEDEAKSDIVDFDEAKGDSVESESKRSLGDNVEDSALVDSLEPMCEDEVHEEKKTHEEDNSPESGKGEEVNERMENGLVDKPLRRFTRSLMKQEGDSNNSNIRKITKPENLGEVKDEVGEFDTHDARSLKKLHRNFPARLKDLLGMGILEGLTVYYLRGAKTREAGTAGLKGVITGSGILCFCSACKGTQVVSPNVFESHASSPNKRPPEYILLETGNTLRDVMNICRNSSLATLEGKLRVAVGPTMKKSSMCFNCQGSLTETWDTKTLILCKLCLEIEEHEKVPQTSSPKVCGNVEILPEPRVVPETIPSESKSSPLKSNSKERLTRKDLRLHKLVFEDDVLPDGTEVGYYVAGKRMLVGHKKAFGIHCSCCNTVISPSQFEAHAGCASRRKPFQHIYTTNGVSLHELSVALSRDHKFCVQENDDLCSICKDGGDLLCCDTCPRSFHTLCASLSSLPSGRWSCKYCTNMFLREKFVECNANALAAGRVLGVDAIAEITKRCIRIVSSLGSGLPSVCVLCRGHSFSRLGFNPRTVIICDQCEKEFHVGCLKEHKIADLKELPEGRWFCCCDCERIHTSLQNLIIHGDEMPDNNFLNFIRKKRKPSEEDCSDDSTDLDIKWRVLSGRLAASDYDMKTLLARAVSIFHERFDPISESGTRGDLIPAMVYGRQAKGQDFSGMFCIMLTVNQVIVSVGVFRIFGSELAELPLVATSSDCQGQGYFQCMFGCIQRLMGLLKVKHLVLPAADEAKSIWTDKFGFTKMTPEEVNEYRKDFQVMVFEGTSMLRKPVPETGAVTN